MKKKAMLNSTSKQIFVLSLISSLFVVPYLMIHGTNIVTHTYAGASRQFWLGGSPYLAPPEGGDWYKYAPFFAMLYTPFAFLGPGLQAAVWGVFNIIIYWIGLSVWFPWADLGRRFGRGAGSVKWLWLGFLFCSMELDGSTKYQQINASLVGSLLVGLFLYQRGILVFSGLLLSLITQIKVLPGLFLLGLIYPFRKRFLLGILLGLMLGVLLPMVVWGWARTWQYHLEWLALLNRDTQTTGLLDLVTTLSRLGVSDAKRWFGYPLGVVSLVVFFGYRIRCAQVFDWGLWISFGVLTLLLVNPRTESPTFVMAAPAFVFIPNYCLRLSKKARVRVLSVWGMGVFFVTLCMNDIWPKALWNPSGWFQMNKVLGVLILWVLTLVLIGFSSCNEKKMA